MEKLPVKWLKKCQKFNHGQRKLALMIYDSSNFLTFWRQINGNMMIQKFMKSSQYKICRIHLIFFDFSESLTKTITGNRLIRNQRKQFPWKQNMYYLFNYILMSPWLCSCNFCHTIDLSCKTIVKHKNESIWRNQIANSFKNHVHN